MMMDNRNQEGYKDPTATEAIRNVTRERERKANGFIPKPIYKVIQKARTGLEKADCDLLTVRAIDRKTGKIYVWIDGSER